MSMHPIAQIDRQQLKKYLKRNISHEDNPEIFTAEMQKEVDNNISIYEENLLKQMQKKMKIEQIQNQKLKEQEELKKKLQDKLEAGIKKKEKMIEERVKSMANIRNSKEIYMMEKIRNNRNQNLRQSMKKINEIQNRFEKVEQERLKRAQSDSHFRKENNRMQKKQEMQNEQYRQLVQKVEKRKIYEISQTKQLKKLYAERVKSIKQSQAEIESTIILKLGQSLQKIQKARQKKEALINQKTAKLRQIESYNNETRKLREQEKKDQALKEKTQQRRKEEEKINRLIAKNQIDKQQKVRQKKIHSKCQNLSDSSSGSKQKRKNLSYKEEIKRHIEAFIRKEKANSYIK